MLTHKYSSLAQELKSIVGPENALFSPEEIFVYESDAVPIMKGKAEAVLLPGGAEEIQKIVKLARQHKIPFVARGAGTGLSGGCTASQGGWLISTARLNRILEIDLENRVAVVQPGVVNSALSNTLEPYGYQFAPDPSSQQVCTIGGNFAENAGGPHCLKYGMTCPHILGVKVILPSGELLHLGGKIPGSSGYDLLGILVGSEGTLGIVTELTVRLTPLPEEVRTFLGIFPSVARASEAVSSMIASGIIPAALEMLDKLTLEVVEEFVHADYPKGSEAVLLIEVDGSGVEVEEDAEAVREICRENHALEIREAKENEERKKLWLGRKSAFGAFGRISPDFFVMDGVVPPSKLPLIMKRIAEISRKYDLRIANVFHAGDGNLHPNILFDRRKREMAEKVLQAGEEVLRECVALGGVISGEHGIGLEKQNLMPLMFSPEDLQAMEIVRSVFNPDHLCNPGKIFPTGKSCGEVPSGSYLNIATWN